MEKIIGQVKLIQTIDSLKTLPHSFALIGEEGAGKHLLVNYINEKFFNLSYLDITENHDEDDLDNIFRYPQKRLYVLDIGMITSKEQNKLLKFIEEPFDNIYICLLCNNTNLLLPTIRNRIIIYKLNPYSLEELSDFSSNNDISIDNKYMLTILRTPGDIKKIKDLNVNLDDVCSLSDKIVHKINVASFPNTLSIIDKINFKDEYDKIDLTFLLRVLSYKYFEEYVKTKNNIYFSLYEKVVKTKTALNCDSRLDKKRLVTSMLIALWKENHQCS